MFPFTAHPAGALTIATMLGDHEIAAFRARHLARETRDARRAAARADAARASRPLVGQVLRFRSRAHDRSDSVAATGH
jgi:hypothetical protein